MRPTRATPTRRGRLARAATAGLAAAVLAAGLVVTTGADAPHPTTDPVAAQATDPVGPRAEGPAGARDEAPAVSGGSATPAPDDVTAAAPAAPDVQESAGGTAPAPDASWASTPATPARDTEAPPGAPRDADAPEGTRPAPDLPAPPTWTPGAPVPPDPTEPAVAPGTVSGTLVRLWAEQVADDPGAEGEHDDHDQHDGHDGHDGHDHHDEIAAAALHPWLETETTAYPLVDADVADVEDGAGLTVVLAPAGTDGAHPVQRVLQVTAPVLAAGEVGYGQSSTDLLGLAAAAVVHDVTVVLALPPGASADSMTTTTMAATVNGGVNTFWSQQTRGQRGFRVVKTVGWQRLTTGCDDAFGLWDEAAAKAGFVSGTRKHLVVYIPKAAGCGAGLGTVGPSPDAGGRSWVGSSSTSIVAHELGHNLGLGHSNGLLCTGRADGTFASGAWQSGCAAHGYRDFYDVMGVSWDRLGSLAAPQADALGVLRSTEKLATSGPVRARLVPATGEGLRALRIDDPAGAYYVEYRVPTSWDAWLASNTYGLDAGVLVHRLSPVKAREVLLLDGSVTAGTRTSDWRSALPAGATLTTASGTTRITVERQDATGATIVVQRDGVTPPVVVAPSDGSLVQIQAPTAVAAAAGTTLFAGVASAPEGTLQWEVWQGDVLRSSGWTSTGANGAFDSFQVPMALPAGTWTFRVRVPDESDGESTLDPARLVDEVTLVVG